MTECLVCLAPLPPVGLRAVDRLHGLPGTHVVARCSDCGAGRTLPATNPEHLGRFYPDDYSPYEPATRPLERLISSLIRRVQGQRARARPPLATMAKRPPGVGLDVGCGRGDVAAAFAGLGWLMVGIEPSAAAADAARAQGVEVHVGVLATVPLPTATFDGVVFQHSLEHTEQPRDDLRLAYQALKPGGVLCISVPNFGGWQARRFGSRWYHLDVPRHRTHFTPSALRLALQATGFEAIAVTTSASAVGLPASIQYRAVGRCLFPGGLKLRIAAGLCVIALPVVTALDGLGSGDTLHATAVKPGA